MNENITPVRPRRRRRRRRRLNPRFVFTLGVLVALIVGIIVLCVCCSGDDEEAQDDVPVTTQPITMEDTEPSTQETTEPPTQPAAATPMDELEAFAAEHGLTVADYPQPIIELLERNPEAREFALNYPLEYGKEHEIDISGYADYEGVPLFIQWDKQWGYRDYVGSVAGLSACGPTTLSMAAYYFTRDPSMTPAYIMDFAEKEGYGLKGSGTQWSLFNLGAEKLGLKVKPLTAEQLASESQLAKILESGKLIVVNVKPGVFTTVGHYMLVVGYEDGKFRINDPNSPANSAKAWAFDEFDQDIKMMWSLDG